MTYVTVFEHLIHDNQLFLTALLFCGSYFLKRLVDHFAARPQTDFWDKLKPGSDALYLLVQRGVDYLAKSKKLDSAAKLLEYVQRIEQFEKTWRTDRTKAIRELAAWYLSMKAKDVSANPSPEPLTADTPAVE